MQRGAKSVKTYTMAQTQQETIFTQTDGQLRPNSFNEEPSGLGTHTT